MAKLIIPRFKNPKFGKQVTNYKYDPTVHGVSQSMIATWLDCREKARLATLNGWTIDGASKPFTYGDLSHGVLERCYSDIRARRVKNLAQIRNRMEGYLKGAEEHFWIEHNNPTTEVTDLVEECMAVLTGLLPHYFERWYKEDIAVKWLFVEDEFKVPVTMPDGVVVPMVGKFDGAFSEDGKVGLFETKNKGQWSSRLVDLLPLDLQVGYYTAALKKKKMTPDFTRYNLLRRPQERRKAAETLKQFIDRIGDNVRKDPTHYFERYEVHLSKNDIDTNIARAEALIVAYYQWWKSTDPDKRDLCWNSGHCENKYGTCQFLDICSKGDYGRYHVRGTVSPELAAPK